MRTLIIFQASRFLEKGEEESLKAELRIFLADWNAHGVSLVCDFELRHALFLIFKIDEKKQALSGCSRDALFRKVEELGNALQLSFFDRMKVALQVEGKINLYPFSEAKKMLNEDKDVLLFNHLLTQESDLEKSFLLPIRESFLANI